MARANLQIKTGTYVGDGVDSTNITGIGFRPDLIIIKGGANLAVIRTKEMRGDFSIELATAAVGVADRIQEILNDGFQVGANAQVNANGTTYYYIAMRGTAGQSHFRTGNYRGDGADSRDFTVGGLNFTPDIIMIAGDVIADNIWRTSSMSGDSAAFFLATANAADLIQNLQSNGFQLGTSTKVNGSTTEYFFAAMKALAGVIAVGTFVGDGTDNRNITGLGFQPDMVMLKNADAGTAGRFRTSGYVGDDASFLTAAASATNQIQSFLTDGFQVGTSSNANAANWHWIAFKAGDHNAPITRTVA